MGLTRLVGKGEIDRPNEGVSHGRGARGPYRQSNEEAQDEQKQAEQDAEGHGHYSRSAEEKAGDEEGGKGREKGDGVGRNRRSGGSL